MSVVYVLLECYNTLIRTRVALHKIDAVHPPPVFFASMMACQTNHAINVLLYCLSGMWLVWQRDHLHRKGALISFTSTISSMFCYKLRGIEGQRQGSNVSETTHVLIRHSLAHSLVRSLACSHDRTAHSLAPSNCSEHSRADRPTDSPTDTPSYRDAQRITDGRTDTPS